MKLNGQKYGIDEWDFFIIPTNDIEQQLNSVDCGVFVVKWAQHIAEGRMIDFKQRHINDFRYSLILDIAENKLSCLSNPFPSNEGSNSCEQTANSNAKSILSHHQRLETAIQSFTIIPTHLIYRIIYQNRRVLMFYPNMYSAYFHQQLFINVWNMKNFRKTIVRNLINIE